MFLRIFAFILTITMLTANPAQAELIQLGGTGITVDRTDLCAGNISEIKVLRNGDVRYGSRRFKGVCQPQAAASGKVTSGKRWVGVMAIKESPLVNLTIRQHDNDPARYGPALRRLLDNGQVQSAPGRYCLVPYAGGKPANKPECYNITRTGIWTRWAPANMVQPGRAMCAQAPKSWPAIAGQQRYPVVGGKLTNCYDFGSQAAAASFAATRKTAAMIVMIKPAG